jgi:hypothetical protein
MTSSDKLQQLLDKEAIREKLMSYSRGVDRHDRDLLLSVYWPDAEDDHILYKGDPEGFADFSFEFTKNVPTSHMLLNNLIAFDSPASAQSETYYLGYHNLPTEDGGTNDFLMGGRYLDLFEKRGDEWRIKKRVLTCDFYTVAPSTAQWGEGLLAPLKTRGAHGQADPLYWALS